MMMTTTVPTKESIHALLKDEDLICVFDKVFAADGGSESVIENILIHSRDTQRGIRDILDDIRYRLHRLYDTEPGTELMGRLSFQLTADALQSKLDSKHTKSKIFTNIRSANHSIDWNQIHLKDIWTIDSINKLYKNKNPHLYYKSYKVKLNKFNYKEIRDILNGNPLRNESKIDVLTLYVDNTRARHRDLFNLLCSLSLYYASPLAETKNFSALMLQSFFLVNKNHIKPSSLTRISKSVEPLKPFLFENTVQQGQNNAKQKIKGNVNDIVSRTALGLESQSGTNSFVLISPNNVVNVQTIEL